MISNLGIPSDANDPFSSKVKDEFVLSLTAKSTKELAGPQSQPKHWEVLSIPVLGGIIVRLAIPPRFRTPRHPYIMPALAFALKVYLNDLSVHQE